MCKITKENDSLQRQTENKDENSQYLLKDVLNKIIDFRGKTPLKLGMKWGGNIPALSAMNVKDGIIKFNEDTHYGSIELYEKWMTKGDCTKGDIVLTMEAPMGNVAQIPNNQKYILSQRVILLKFNEKLVSNEYMYQYLRSPYFKKQMNRYATGTTAKGIKQKNLIKIRLKIPSLLEQKFIGTFLSAIDKKIGFMEKKHTLYQNIKKYYSHVLFSNTSDWNKKNLKDIAIIKMGFTPSTKKEEYWNGNIKWLAVSDMGSKYISKTKKHITKIAIGKKEIIKKDTLVMSFKLTIGKLGILKEDMYSNEAICNFQWKNKNINTEFMYYYLSSINLKKYGSQAAKGITLNKETLNMIPIRIPSYETQINIVNILSNIDIKLEYLSKKINYEKRYKKGLLQKMFV